MEERDCAAAFALVLNGNFATIASHATGIARSRKTPEKVFVLLDMLTAWEKERALAETLTSLGEHGGVAGQLASKVQEMYTMLVNSARDTYREFAMAVERDDVGGSREGKVEGTRKKVSGLIPTPTKGLRLILAGPQDGHQSQSSVPENATIHPLTAYLIQYCRRLQQYPSASRILNRRATGTTREEGEDLAGRMISRLLHTLLKNLKIKVQRLSHGKQASDGQDAQHFADVFMLNNANYILSRARCFEHAEALEQIGFFQEMRETVHSEFAPLLFRRRDPLKAVQAPEADHNPSSPPPKKKKKLNRAQALLPSRFLAAERGVARYGFREAGPALGPPGREGAGRE